ncbi:S8 family serine peptidase [Candidatus Chloroploca sp. M-50]|uniref:S8 family serine peptidase n=1 Tax=Candidatus Chloroploca mongolica TaxID=2528176 RepID=A0ABS4D6G0_9CHLR|nr:S8 family serine peptidase [Candidatus Chloroploca mongolica]MBP1465026.1 S8 family serine peptidase [Candidatus Chloroploca mongolica]
MLKHSVSLLSLLVISMLVLTFIPGYAFSTRTHAEPSIVAAALDAHVTKAKAHADDGPARYIVQLTDPPLATYTGGIVGIPATNPRLAGTNRLDPQSVASQRYRAYLALQRQQVIVAAEQVLGDELIVEQVFATAFNGFVSVLSPEQATQLAALPGVVQVTREAYRQLHTNSGPSIIGASQLDTRPAIFRADLGGANEVPPVSSEATGSATFHYDATSKMLSFTISSIGVTVSGPGAHIHQAAADANGPAVVDLAPYQLVNGQFLGSVILSQAVEDALFAGELYINLHEAPDFLTGKIRGQILPNRGEGVLVGVIDTGIDPFNPAFAATGADGYTHTNPFGEGVYKGVCADPESPAYHDGFRCNAKLVGAYTFPASSESFDPMGRTSPFDDHGHGSHTASTAAGNILQNVQAEGSTFDQIGGVAAHANLIIYDGCLYDGCPTSALVGAIDQATQDGVAVINYSIGGYSRDPWVEPDALAFRNALEAGILASVSAGNSGPDAATIGAPSNAPWVMSIAATTKTDLTADFSSRGPDATVPDVLKPDVAAPGVGIIAAVTVHWTGEPQFAVASGTSMAAPHNAGAAALLRQRYPAWTPSEVRSALMTTAEHTSDDPFEVGAGRINVGRAMRAGFVLDETAANFAAADPTLGGNVTTLNLPSLTNRNCFGECVWIRTLKSTLPVTTTWTPAFTGTTGLAVTVSPAMITLAPGATQIITITASGSELAVEAGGTEARGYLTFTPAIAVLSATGDLPRASFPLAIEVRNSNLPATINIRTNALTQTIELDTTAIAITDLQQAVYGMVQPDRQRIRLSYYSRMYTKVLTPSLDRTMGIIVETANSTAPDVDLVVGFDNNNDGILESKEVLCFGFNYSAEETCDLFGLPNLRDKYGLAEDANLLIIVWLWASSEADVDTVDLYTAVVPTTPIEPGNLTITGPQNQPIGQPFKLRVGWSLPDDSMLREHFYGAFTLGSAPGPTTSHNLGLTRINIHYVPHIAYLPWLAVPFPSYENQFVELPPSSGPE